MYKTSIFILIFLTSASVYSQNRKKRVKIKYKSHTQIDFTGEKIEGRLKAPAVFYIFQRKRSKGHQVSLAPQTLGFHDKEIKLIVKDTLGK